MTAVMVCGGGNAAQVVTCLFGARYKVTALCLHEDEAARWSQEVQKKGYMSCKFMSSNKEIRSTPDAITKDPSCASNCDIILFTMPWSFHAQYFKALAPHVKAGTIFAVMPARSGCDFLFKKVMGDKADKLGLVAFETLPWACKFKIWGQTAEVLGTKETIGAAVVPPAGKTKTEVILKLQGLLGMEPVIDECPNVMTISLSNPGQVIHPGIMYGRWHKWDGKALKEKPLFYHGVDQETADVLEGVSDDITAICKALKRIDSRYDTSQVKTIMEWYLASYQSSIQDASSLMKAMQTNAAYQGLCHPMKEEVKDSARRPGMWVPDFQFRYLTEDVPTGLCFSRGVAELLQVQTPMIDKVLHWSQAKLGKDYLTIQGKMAGRDLAETRAPQAYGVQSKRELCDFLRIQPSSGLSCFAGICSS